MLLCSLCTSIGAANRNNCLLFYCFTLSHSLSLSPVLLPLNMQNNDMRRTSLVALRRGSLRRGSVRRASLVPSSTSLDLPWDILDRLLIPILCCHAAAIILSSFLNLLHISDVSTLTLFAWFALSTGGAILFYHHLKVCYFVVYFRANFFSFHFLPISLHIIFPLSFSSQNDEQSMLFNRMFMLFLFHNIISAIKLFLTSCHVIFSNRIFIVWSKSSIDDWPQIELLERCSFILRCSWHILFQLELSHFLTHICSLCVSSHRLSASQFASKFDRKFSPK